MYYGGVALSSGGGGGALPISSSADRSSARAVRSILVPVQETVHARHASDFGSSSSQYAQHHHHHQQHHHHHSAHPHNAHTQPVSSPHDFAPFTHSQGPLSSHHTTHAYKPAVVSESAIPPPRYIYQPTLAVPRPQTQTQSIQVPQQIPQRQTQLSPPTTSYYHAQAQQSLRPPMGSLALPLSMATTEAPPNAYSASSSSTAAVAAAVPSSSSAPTAVSVSLSVAAPQSAAEFVDDDLPLPKFKDVFTFALTANGSNGKRANGGKQCNETGRKRGREEDRGDTSGRWTAEEHRLFLEGVMLYGKDWKKMQPLIKTRSLVQIRTHAQKVFKKIGLRKLDAHVLQQQLSERQQENIDKQNMLAGFVVPAAVPPVDNSTAALPSPAARAANTTSTANGGANHAVNGCVDDKTTANEAEYLSAPAAAVDKDKDTVDENSKTATNTLAAQVNANANISAPSVASVVTPSGPLIAVNVMSADIDEKRHSAPTNAPPVAMDGKTTVSTAAAITAITSSPPAAAAVIVTASEVRSPKTSSSSPSKRKSTARSPAVTPRSPVLSPRRISAVQLTQPQTQTQTHTLLSTAVSLSQSLTGSHTYSSHTPSSQPHPKTYSKTQTFEETVRLPAHLLSLSPEAAHTLTQRSSQSQAQTQTQTNSPLSTSSVDTHIQSSSPTHTHAQPSNSFAKETADASVLDEETLNMLKRYLGENEDVIPYLHHESLYSLPHEDAELISALLSNDFVNEDEEGRERARKRERQEREREDERRVEEAKNHVSIPFAHELQRYGYHNHEGEEDQENQVDRRAAARQSEIERSRERVPLREAVDGFEDDIKFLQELHDSLAADDDDDGL